MRLEGTGVPVVAEQNDGCIGMQQSALALYRQRYTSHRRSKQTVILSGLCLNILWPSLSQKDVRYLHKAVTTLPTVCTEGKSQRKK